MSNQINRQWLLKKRPQGEPKRSDFEWVEKPLAPLADDMYRVRILLSAMDPAQRGWMDPSGNYFDPILLGDPVRAVVLGQVVESNCEGYEPGMIVSGLGAWADYVDGVPGMLSPLPVDWGHDLSTWLHPLGAVGATAYYGLFEVCDFKEGDNVLVSAAAGGVGSLVGQFAKIKGAGKVVGIAGGPDKCNWVTGELGFDACIDYKNTSDMSASIGEQLPEGLDVYFDNTGMPILEAAMNNLAMRARIGICGMISEYNATAPEPGPNNMWNLLVKRARIEGLLVADYMDRAMEAFVQINDWIRDGKVRFKVDVRDGLENAPDVFKLLFSGAHDGKLMLKINEQT